MNKKKLSVLSELTAGAAGIALLIYVLRSMLILGKSTLPHDHVYWGYPAFQFFAENIINGHIPLWNPFTHGGEPFYPLLVIQKLIDPIPLLTVYIGQFFTDDIVCLYNWNHFIQCIIMATGIYIVFRSIADHWLIRVSLIPILLFSSITLGSFHQAAGLYHSIWIPYITYFLLRIVYKRDHHWHNWLFLAALIGLNWQSYFFAGTWIFLLFFFAGFLFFRRDLLIDLFKNRKTIPRVSVAFVIICIMMLPNIVIFLENDRYVYPARLIDSDTGNTSPMAGPQQFEGSSVPKEERGIVMPYTLIANTGTFSTIWDFIQIISPRGNKWIQSPGRNNMWGKPSEAYMYVGLLPWAIALLGIALGKHDLKKIWLFILIAFGLLILGPAGGLHRLLYYVYPPLWFVRHTHGLSLIFLFAFLFFYILGSNYIYYMYTNPRPQTGENFLNSLTDKLVITENIYRIAAYIIFSGSIVYLTFLMTKLGYPDSNYIFLLLTGCFIVGWLLRKYLRPEGMWAGLMTSHIFIMLIVGADRIKFMTRTIFLIGVPIIIFLYIRKRHGITRKKYLTSLLLILFAASLTVDFTKHIKLVSYLFEGQPHPQIAYHLDNAVTKPVPAHNREIAPMPLFGFGSDPQALRYISLLYRRPYVFSPIMQQPDYENIVQLREDVTSQILNNNSFEKWTTIPGGTLLPEGYTYTEDGTNGFLKRNELMDGVKFGNYSLALSPSSQGNSMLRTFLNNIDGLKGHIMKMSAWVKSRNVTRDAVQVDIQDGISPVKVRSYSNSGEWENIELFTHIPEKAENIFLTLNVKHNASNEAWFDEIKIFTGQKTDNFELSLYSKRWNSFLMLKDYFKLIHSGIPPRAIKEMFAVEKLPFQFKQGIIGLRKNEFSPFLKKLGTQRSVELLDNYILVSNADIDSSLNQATISPDNYNKMIRNNASAHNHNDNDFSFSHIDYSYSSFSINTAAKREGFLYWSDGFDDRWHAYINDEEIPVYRANVNFKAIRLPEGASHVRFVYNHPLFKLALSVFYGAFFLTIVIALITGFKSADISVSGK